MSEKMGQIQGKSLLEEFELAGFVMRRSTQQSLATSIRPNTESLRGNSIWIYQE